MLASPTRVETHDRRDRRVASVSAVAVDLAADDGLLVARMAAGDDDAIAEVFDRYASFVLGIAQRVLRNASLAEDVVQDVFAALWTNPQRFDASRGSLRAYLGVQAHRRAVDSVRSEVRRQTREIRSAGAGGRTEDAGGSMDEAALAACVREAIERLPDDQRAAVELAFWHGRTHREVAAILAIPEGTAKSRLRLAQAKLAIWLAPLEGEPA
jgi:RNA polymerase sigma-70 factor (ECF subfamily)